MSVETVVAPVVKGRARPEWTAWSESVDLDSSHVFALRVFYSKSLVHPGTTTGASPSLLQQVPGSSRCAADE